MFDSSDAICPYYRSSSTKKKRFIRCEGLVKGASITQSFSHDTQVTNHKFNFCDSGCWKGCPIAQMLDKK